MPPTAALHTALYHKPIHKLLYMHPNTFQPDHIKVEHHYNELKRITKTCSLPKDYIIRIYHQPDNLGTLFHNRYPLDTAYYTTKR